MRVQLYPWYESIPVVTKPPIPPPTIATRGDGDDSAVVYEHRYVIRSIELYTVKHIIILCVRAQLKWIEMDWKGNKICLENAQEMPRNAPRDEVK
jgi:hypothetical protein